MGDDTLNNPVHQVLSDYTLLDVKSCEDVHFSLDHPSSFRLNLCAISQLYPTKYFIAVNNEIRVYGLSGGHVFTRRPIVILKPSTNPGFLINSLKVDSMVLTPAHYQNATEILVAVGDNGEIFAWDIQRLFPITKEISGSDVNRPFLRKVNVEQTENEASGGISTWGIALHVHGLLAVSANNNRITIYNLLEKCEKNLGRSSAEGISNYLGDREQVELAGHVDNIPCIDFDSTGRYLASGSIDMTCRLWDLSTLQQIGKRSMTRTFDGDAWLWGVKFISPGNFKYAKCENSLLSHSILRKIENGRSTSVSDLNLAHSAPYPVYQLDMGQMFSRLNTGDDSDDNEDYDIGAALGGINQRVIDLNDGDDGGSDPLTDITRLIRLSNLLQRHLQQQPSQTEVADILLDNNEAGVPGLELDEALLYPSLDDRLVYQYEEPDDQNEEPNDVFGIDVDALDLTMFENSNGGNDADFHHATWSDDFNTSHHDGLYDTYNNQEQEHQEWSDFEDQTSQGFAGNIDDDLDALFEQSTMEQQRLEDLDDAHLLDWEDRYVSSMAGDEDDESMASREDNGIYDQWQEQEQGQAQEQSWDRNNGAADNDIPSHLSDLNDDMNQPLNTWNGWEVPQMNQREDYEDLMLEEENWMEDRSMFPWHWAGIRPSNEQDRSSFYDREEEIAQQLTSNVTHDPRQDAVPAWATSDNNDTEPSPATSRVIKSLNPTVLVPPTRLSIGNDERNLKIPSIFESTESSDEISENSSSVDGILWDYLIITTKKDAYLLNVSQESSSSSSSSSPTPSQWPTSTMNDSTRTNTMTTIQRERHIVSHADSRTEERLNMMERLSFVEWVPELELCVMASQKGCVVLTRILQVQLDSGDNGVRKTSQWCLFNHEKYLPMHGLQNSVLYGMTVHRLPSADNSRGFSAPIYQLLLLYLDGTMRSYLISKPHPQVSSSSASYSLSDLYSAL